MRFFALRSISLIVVIAAISGCDDGTSMNDGMPIPARACKEAAPDAVRVCIAEVSTAIRACYTATNAPCTTDNAVIMAALSALDQAVRESCSDEDTGALTVDAFVGRLQTSCDSESVSLASRTFGGPHGAVWAGAASGRSCLEQAHSRAAALVDASLIARQECLGAETCDADALADEEAETTAAAVADVEGACPGLQDLIALDAAGYIARAMHQVDCMTATVYADTAPLAIACGPTNADADLPVESTHKSSWTKRPTARDAATEALSRFRSGWRPRASLSIES